MNRQAGPRRSFTHRVILAFVHRLHHRAQVKSEQS